LAALVDIAGQGLAAVLWQSMAEEGQSPIEIGRLRLQREDGLSYRNAQMVEVGGEVAGCLVGYRLEFDDDDLSDAPPLVRGLIELELEVEDYWYVNILAVYPEYRGHGIGTMLLKEADRLGREGSSRGMAIIVASGNIGARRLYERSGYTLLSKRGAPDYPGGRVGQEWLLLTKPHS
jgi:ribosomal protein S18 acetylase RimI-like enzyme